MRIVQSREPLALASPLKHLLWPEPLFIVPRLIQFYFLSPDESENPNLFVSDIHFAIMLVIRYTEERSCWWLFLCEKDAEGTNHPSRS